MSNPIKQSTAQVELNLTELAIIEAAVCEYRELVASPTSADRAALGDDWADREVNTANALLNGKLADAAKRAQATSEEDQSALSEAAPENAPQALEGASVPFLLECHMANKQPELGVSIKGYFVTNPFYDVGMIDEVDPMECWGLTEAQAKFIVTLNEQLAEAAEDAINAGCLRLQNAAGITDGGYAGVHFSGPELRNQLMRIFGEYIASDINASRVDEK